MKFFLTDEYFQKNDPYYIYKPKKYPRYFFLNIIRFFLYWFGYSLVNRIVYSNSILERWDMRLPFYFSYLEKFLNKEPVIFDVGAHMGESVYLYKKIFSNSIIYSFEPHNQSYNKLVSFINENKIDKVKCFNIGIGSDEEKKKFYIFKNKNTLLNSFVRPDFDENIDTTYYKIITGDKFCKTNSIKDIDILKINCQGMELSILEGFRKKIKENSIKIIILEFDYSGRYSSSSGRIGNYENFLFPYNYTLFDILLLRREIRKDKQNINRHIKIKHGYVMFINKELSIKFANET